jgi:hypothetical protein
VVKCAAPRLPILACALLLATAGVAASLPFTTALQIGQAGACVAIALALGVGPGRPSVIASSDGVRIRNAVRRHVIPWRRIRGFRLDSGLLGSVCVIDLYDGAPRRVRAIQLRRSTLARVAHRRIRMLQELNGLMFDHRRRSSRSVG